MKQPKLPKSWKWPRIYLELSHELDATYSKMFIIMPNGTSHEYLAATDEWRTWLSHSGGDSKIKKINMWTTLLPILRLGPLEFIAEIKP